MGGVIIDSEVGQTGLELSCPVVKHPSYEDKNLCVGMLDKDLDDLRKIRTWLEVFDNQCDREHKMVFVTDEGGSDVTMETLVKIRTLSEMLGL